MKKCEKCGKEVLETEKECPYCGHVLKEKIELSETEKQVGNVTEPILSKEEKRAETNDEVKETGTGQNQKEVDFLQSCNISAIEKPVKEKLWFKRKSFIIPTIIAVLFFFLWVSDDSSAELEKSEAELSEVQMEYNEYKSQMEPFEEYSLEDIEQAKMTREKEEAAEQKALEEEKKKGYNTGITYEQLARTPDKYAGKKVKFSGKVIQVIEGDDEIQIRLAVNDDYDTVLYGGYDPSIVNSRILEDDYITIYGVSVGTISYDSTLGGKITIPGVAIEKIDQ